MKWLREWWWRQWVSHKNVAPRYIWDERKSGFYLVSLAGMIFFKPNTERELCEFRDRYINRFSQCKNSKDYFKVYRDIRRQENWPRLRYRANFHTRLKACLRLWG